MNRFVFSCCIAAAFVTPAAAADELTSTVGWGGFYGGISLGYGKHDPAGLYDSGDLIPFNGRDIDGRGVIGGVQAGYNWQVDNWVFGVEADINGSTVEDSKATAEAAPTGPDIVKVELDYFGTIRARVGITQDQFLIYGTGGLAFAGSTVTITDAGTATTGSKDYSEIGYAIGGGVEYALTENWSIKGEYVFHHFSDKSNIGGGAFADADAGDFYSNHKIHATRIGLNYRF